MVQLEEKSILSTMVEPDRGALRECFDSPANTDQMIAIMERLDELLARVGPASPTLGYAPRYSPGQRQGDALRKARAPLPDPRLVRNIILYRQSRDQFFDKDLFGDPAWDMLLDLTVARAEHRRVSVTSLCIASGVPTSTALRWIKQLEDSGLIQRVEDDTDRRRVFITLSERGAEAMAHYFEAVGKQMAKRP